MLAMNARGPDWRQKYADLCLGLAVSADQQYRLNIHLHLFLVGKKRRLATPSAPAGSRSQVRHDYVWTDLAVADDLAEGCEFINGVRLSAAVTVEEQNSRIRAMLYREPLAILLD